MAASIAGCCILLQGFSALAQEDTAGGQTITELLDSVEEEGFSRWDREGDGQLNPDEFYSYAGEFFEQWDKDADAALKRGEWKSGVSQHYGFREYVGEFGEWDLNGNQNLDKNEFTAGLFRLFDGDRNRQIERKEFEYWTWNPREY